MHEVGAVNPATHIPKIGSGIVPSMPGRKPSDITECTVSILSSALNIFLYCVSSELWAQ